MSKFEKYKRGQFIIVKFNNSIGSELKGHHPAIVITKKDNPLSSKLTIIPLSSKANKHYLKLGQLLEPTEIYAPIINNLNDLFVEIHPKIELSHDAQLFFSYMKSYNFNIKNFKTLDADNFKNVPAGVPINKYLDILADEIKNVGIIIDTTIQEIEKNINIINRFHGMFKESYAVINNITTVSKYRIIKPINKIDPLKNIIVTDEILDMIDKEIIKHYTK